MKALSSHHRDASALRSSKGEAGFTLVELIAVISIIAILAAAVTGAVVYASKKAAVTNTQALFQRLSLAINAYRQDYGAYPPDRNPADPMPGGWWHDFDPGLPYLTMPAETLPYFLSGMYEHPNVDTIRDTLARKTSYLSFRQKELKRTGFKFGTNNLANVTELWTRTDWYPELVDVWGSPIYYIHTVDPTNPSDPDNPRVNNVSFDLVSRGPDRVTGNGNPGRYEKRDEEVVIDGRTVYPNRDNIIRP